MCSVTILYSKFLIYFHILYRLHAFLFLELWRINFEEIKFLSYFYCSIFSLTNLTTDAVYEIRMAGATKSIYQKSLVYRGQFSPIRSMLLASDCIYYHTETAIGDPHSSNSAGIIPEIRNSAGFGDYREQQVGIVIGLTATLGCIFLIALSILVWR